MKKIINAFHLFPAHFTTVTLLKWKAQGIKEVEIIRKQLWFCVK